MPAVTVRAKTHPQFPVLAVTKRKKAHEELSEKLRAKFPPTTPGCSMLTVAYLDDAFSEVFFNPKQAQYKVNHCSKKEEKRRKRKGEKEIPKIGKPKEVGHFLLQKLSQNLDFCACPSHNALKCEVGGQKAKLLCCKRLFNRINPLTPAFNCPRPTPDFLAFFEVFQSERKHKNKPYVQ